MNFFDNFSPEHLFGPDQQKSHRLANIFESVNDLSNVVEIRRARTARLNQSHAARAIMQTELVAPDLSSTVMPEAEVTRGTASTLSTSSLEAEPILNQPDVETLSAQPVGDELAEMRRLRDEARQMADDAHKMRPAA